jgi:hypothetical protein
MQDGTNMAKPKKKDKVQKAMVQDKKAASKVIASKKKATPTKSLAEFKKTVKTPKPRDIYATKDNKATVKGKGRSLVATKKQVAIQGVANTILRNYGL